MQKPSKETIIRAYNDLVREQYGKPIGEGVFKRETGILGYYWRGGYWRSWSAFQANAGYSPNSPTQKIPDEILLDRFAKLVLERNEIPTQADLALNRKEDLFFPIKPHSVDGVGETRCLARSPSTVKGKNSSHQ